ncbi:MAG: TDP-N-acetylfucosamine:lipid II N-acetylfucosaminyltransferase [Pedococcus sp.]
MRILHVGSRSQFVDFLVGYFEQAAPGQNTVVRLPSSAGTPGIRSKLVAVLTYARLLASVVGRARAADVVVAHMLTLPSALAIVAARRSTYTVWSGWGVDYYGDGTESGYHLYGEQTARLSRELGLTRGPRGGRPVRLLTQWLVDKAARRADAFSAPIPDDFAVMTERFPGFAGTYHQLNYADMSSFATSSDVPVGADILLGNSARAANNHLEAFEWLSAFELVGRKVFTPLAYGDATYREAVVARGRQLLGEAFDPLLAPMPFEDYQQRARECVVLVMNHKRQQGLGNVGIGLYSGAHVYLARDNPLFSFLTRAGLDVVDIDSADSLPRTPVSGVALVRRRELMELIWAEDVVLANVQRLLAIAEASDPRARVS